MHSVHTENSQLVSRLDWQPSLVCRIQKLPANPTGKGVGRRRRRRGYHHGCQELEAGRSVAAVNNLLFMSANNFLFRTPQRRSYRCVHAKIPRSLHSLVPRARRWSVGLARGTRTARRGANHLHHHHHLCLIFIKMDDYCWLKKKPDRPQFRIPNPLCRYAKSN